MLGDNWSRSRWSVESIGIFYLLLFLMQLGIFFLALPIILFPFFAFGCLLVKEKSAVWNGLLTLLFWAPALAIGLAIPGTENIARGQRFREALVVLALAVVHGMIQSASRGVLNGLRRK